MNIKEYQNIYKQEDKHFFYTANHQLILELIKTYQPLKNLKVLDAGCGTGLLAKKLKKFGEVIGVDINSEAIKFAKKRGINVKKSSINKLPFKENSFDLITCIDVLYHLGVQDQTALKEFFRVLKPEGILILRVPANKWLKLSHDKHVHLRERYSKDLLRDKLIRAGFVIEKLSFINMALLPPVILSHLSQKINPPKNNSSSIKTLPTIINKVGHLSLAWESKVLSKFNLPFGLGLIAVCKKPS